MSTEAAGSSRRRVDLPGYAGLEMFLGDLHNHCGISYGHGSLADAYANAALQLDFASVTGHASWHDMPRDDPRLAHVVAFHEEGFRRLAACWDEVQELTTAVHEDGRFVSFLSFEWHSASAGDRCVYYKASTGDLIYADSLAALHGELRARIAQGSDMLALPHHLAYPRGFRGIDWSQHDAELAPVAEIVSMHGCGERDEGPRPYLHVMGPRDGQSTAQRGLQLGHRFGFIGSTDHHSAHPGSFGYGRACLWAERLDRDSLWAALRARRTYAVTGDPILLATSLNGAPMGGVVPANRRRSLAVRVRALAPIDVVEVVRTGTVIERAAPARRRGDVGGAFSGTVPISLGWGRRSQRVRWDVALAVTGGVLEEVVPRLRGEDIVMPEEEPPASYRVSEWGRRGENGAWLRTETHGNANVVTDNTQGLVLAIRGDDHTVITVTGSGFDREFRLGELRRAGASVAYSAGLESPALVVGRAVHEDELELDLALTDEGTAEDWYYVRVRQTNDQWAWSSPTWVGAS